MAERALGRGDDAALGLDQLGRGEADGAGHGLAMPEGRRQRLAHQRLGRTGRHLDVVAQDIVVPHLQRLDAGLADVPGLQRGHHLAAVVAQAARLVEVGAVAGAHEAAIAPQVRRRIDEGAREQGLQLARAPRQALGDGGKRIRQADAAGPRAQQAGAGARGRQPVAHGGKVARLAALQGQPRDGAGDIGRGAQQAAHVLAQGLVLAQEAHRIEPCARSPAGSRRGPDSRAASSRAPGPVTVRSMAASRLPCRSPVERAQQLEARPARRIDDEAVGGPGLARRPQARAPADLRQLHVLEERADGGQLRARELAEGLQIGDAQLRLEQPLAGEAVEGGAGHRRRRRAGNADPLPHLLVGEQPVGGDHLARRQAHDLAGEVGRRHLAHLELAGRDVERGQRDHVGLAAAGLGAVEHGGQIVARLGVEQAVLGQRAGRDEAHHVAAHHRLGAALPGLRRVLQLLAHGDAEALPDQPLQVFVGAVDRHAAHGDVLAQVLAALGQHDAERLRRGHRVLEEQLVEIAHAVEQQAVRIGRLDLQELRHRGRDARRRDRRAGGAGRLFRGCGGRAAQAHRPGRCSRALCAFLRRAPPSPPLATCPKVGIAFPTASGNRRCRAAVQIPID